MIRRASFLFTLLAVGCSQSAPIPSEQPVTPSPSPAAKVVPAPEAKKQDYSALLDPSKLTEVAPPAYKARFETSQGAFVVEVTRERAPLGADRFYNLVRNGYYDNVRFFRTIANFMVQFGINGDPKVNAEWKAARIPDDKVTVSNTRGRITFATSGKDSRTTQVFINFRDNARLDSMGFAAFGDVVEGMNVVDSLYPGYGEKPSQAKIQSEGNGYLVEEFPNLDYVKTARILNPEPQGVPK